jgi:hypothetical protein
VVHPADPIPKKVRILGALKTNLEAIKKQNSYRTDVARVAVYEGEDLLLGRSLPAIVIVPNSKDIHEPRFTDVQVAHSFEVALSLAMSFLPNTTTSTWHSAITGLVEDVVKVVEDDIQLGGLAVFVEVVDDEVFDIAPEDQIAEAQVTLTMEYRHTVGDPAA